MTLEHLRVIYFEAAWNPDGDTVQRKYHRLL